jgi:predicted dinucleotide-binding enzyme
MNVALVGSGKIGATLARRLTQTGHEITLANSRGPASLAPLPFILYDQLPAEAFAGKVVVDATNDYAGRDGDIRQLQDAS